jgi:Flp pilus assembly protein TadD
MEVTDMSRDQQQKLGSSNPSSSGSSSGSSSSSFDDLAAAQQQREASTAQQPTEIQRLAQLLKQQHEQQARQQHWKDVRQQWWERLQQQHPQAIAEAEVNKLRQVAQEIETELINTLKAGGSSSSSTASERKPSETYYQRRDNAAAAREAGDQALKHGNANAALKQYNAAVAKLQIDPRSYVGRAQVWLRLRRPQHAEQDCGVALLLATAPEVPLRLGQPQEAHGAVDVAFVARVRRVRAAAWKEMGKLKEAVAVSMSMASAVCVLCV